MSDLSQITIGSAAAYLPPTDLDPLKASVALATQTVSEWLISQLTSDALPLGWPARTISAVPPGTSVKILYHQNELRDDPALAAFARRMTASALVRTTCSRIPDMVIRDRRSAIVFVNSGTLVADSVKTDQPDAISFLTVLFDQAWSGATPLTPPTPSLSSQVPNGHSELVDAELRLLRLLAAGVTDETAARHLGVSLRTARRHMATLMRRLAATSRFQAGVEAVKRGWIT